MKNAAYDQKELRRNKRNALLLRAAVYAAAGLTVAVLCGILLYILIKGVGHLSPELFALQLLGLRVTLLARRLILLTLLSKHHLWLGNGYTMSLTKMKLDRCLIQTKHILILLLILVTIIIQISLMLEDTLQVVL